MHSEKLIQIGIAARRWYEADEQRRLAAAQVRKVTPPPGEAVSVWSAQWTEQRGAESALKAAKQEERAARRALKRLCASGQPDVVDLVPHPPAGRRVGMGLAAHGVTDLVAH